MSEKLTTPSAAMRSIRRSTIDLSSFMLLLGFVNTANIPQGKTNSLRNAIHQQTSLAVVAVVHSDEVPCFVELISTSQTCRSRSYDSDVFASAESGWVRSHPAHPLSALANTSLS